MPLYLIDSSIYIFRAWFSLPQQMSGQDGQAVNAAYGFAKFVTEFLEKTQAQQVVFTFDESLTHSFRNEIYPAYKMNRELPPEELKQQFSLCKRIAQAAGIACVAHQHYEADDLIGTLAMAARQRGEKFTIVSADKDLTQLIGEQDTMWDFSKNAHLQPQHVVEKFGVSPNQITDYLGLCGDAVDRIPGVPGVGPKTAVALLQAYQDIAGVFSNLDGVAGLSIRGAKNLAAKLATYQEQAQLSKQLATIAIDAPIDCSYEFTLRRNAEVSALQEISREIGGRGAGLFDRIVQISNQSGIA